MEEVLKIAENGQWSLEKSMDKEGDAKRMAQIQEFIAQKQRKLMPTARPTAKPTATAPNYPAGMRPASTTTQTHKDSWMPSKGDAASVRRVADSQDPDARRVIERTNISKPEKLDTAPRGPVKPRSIDPGMPPHEMVRDPATNVANFKPREGRFHNEGATTRGKVVEKRIPFEDQLTGELRFRKIPQVEQHHWSWDHNEKKWNHVKTVLQSDAAGK